MDRIAQLQFSAIAPDAQISAVRRLAIKGLNDAEIAQATGWPRERIRSVLVPPDNVHVPFPVLLLNRRSGSNGGPARP